MNEHELRAIEQVKVLWPYIGFDERVDWAQRLRHLFNDDFVKCVRVLSGQDDG